MPCNRGHDDLYWTVCVARFASHGDLSYIHSMLDGNKYYPSVILVDPKMFLLVFAVSEKWNNTLQERET